MPVLLAKDFDDFGRVSVAEQSYVEDCEICCNPIQIYYSAEDFEIADFGAESIEQ